MIDAAGRGQPGIAFAVTSSGPGVTPAAQERYSAARHLEQAGASRVQLDAALRDFDLVVELMRRRLPFEVARRGLEDEGVGTAGELGLQVLPDDAAVWDHACSLIDYDPRPALERIRVPLLALFGSEDNVVPVEESVAVFRAAVRADLLTVAVLPGDHRVQSGDPPATPPRYLEALSSFVTASV